MALRSEVVDFVRADFLKDVSQARAVRHIAMMENELAGPACFSFHQVVDSRSVEQGGASLDAVYLVTLFKQELRKIGAVLPGDAGDERRFRHFSLLPVMSPCPLNGQYYPERLLEDDLMGLKSNPQGPQGQDPSSTDCRCLQDE